MNIKELNNINEIADAIIGELLQTPDPLSSPVVACNNFKVSEWFKAHYLKQKAGVLMNAGFLSFTGLVEEILGANSALVGGERLLSQADFELYIIKAIVSDVQFGFDKAHPENPINYIYDDAGDLNGVNLREFARRLAVLFNNYELDCFDLDGAAAKASASAPSTGVLSIKELEKNIYDAATSYAAADGFYTLKGLYEKRKAEGVSYKKKVFAIDNSYISKLYQDIFELAEDITIYSLDDKKANSNAQDAENSEKNAAPVSYPASRVISAPSKLREVEAVHSEICKIFDKNSSAYDKDAMYNDIIVYAPDINEYANTIRRVFIQDGKEFPEIPFHIVGEVREKQDMKSALAILFEIATKGFFTRKDFYDFVTNPMIRRIRGISLEDADAWMEVIVNTNTHRDGKEDCVYLSDWDYLKKRLAAGVLAGEVASIENVVKFDGQEHLPYSSTKMNSTRTGKLIEMIEALEAWRRLDPCGKDSIIECLDNLFSEVSVDGVEKNYLYKAVKEYLLKIEKLGLMSKLPLDIILLNIQDISDSYKVYPVGMYMSGVTFVSLNADDVVSSKYTFVMGMSSDAYPRVELKSELDSSNKHIASQELDAMAIRNLMRNNDKVVFSFVGVDLATDEEKYLSYFVGFKKDDIEKIPLDETRDYTEIYTLREAKAKEDSYGLGRASGAAFASATSATSGSVQPAKKDVINIYEMKSFLENTIVYKFNSQFKKERDDNSKKAFDEYEEIDLNKLDKSNIIRDIIKIKLDPTLKDAFDELTLKQAMPSQDYGKEIYENLSNNDAEEIVKEIGTVYKLIDIQPITFGSGADVWTLEANTSIYRKIDGTDLYYVLPEKKPDKDKNYLKPYLLSLMDIAILNSPNENIECTVHLFEKKTYTVTPGRAFEILEELYKLMTNREDIKYMDIDFLKNDAPSEIDSIGKFESAIGEHSTWKYFDNKKMIDPKKDFGYPEDGLKDELEDYHKKIKELILFY